MWLLAFLIASDSVRAFGVAVPGALLSVDVPQLGDASFERSAPRGPLGLGNLGVPLGDAGVRPVLGRLDQPAAEHVERPLVVG